jgi:hypothetical protein
MKRINLRAFILLFAVSSAAFAQSAQPASQLEQNLRKHIEYLASDKLEGRRAGEPGANRWKYVAGVSQDRASAGCRVKRETRQQTHSHTAGS